MGDFRVRPAAPSDAAAMVAVCSAVHPYLVRGEAGLRRAIAAPPPGEDWAAFVAESRGAVVGWAVAYRDGRSAEPGSGRISMLQVHPDARGHGLGTGLFTASVAHLRAVGIHRVATITRPESLPFARRHGFEPTRELRFSALPLTPSTHVAPWPPATEPLTPPAPATEPLTPPAPATEPLTPPSAAVEPAAAFEPGSAPRLVSLRETTAEALYAADAAAATDEPGDGSSQPLSFEAWRYDVWDNPDLDHYSSIAAVVDGEIVSFALLIRDGDRVWSDMTATAPTHRGRGLARLVKTEALRRAATAGAKFAFTSNDESNAPMLAVNTHLGYRPVATQFACTATL